MIVYLHNRVDLGSILGSTLILILKMVRARVQGAVAASSGWLSRLGG
jgi:hypothetical protein